MERPAKLVPYPYQAECVGVIVDHFVKGADRALVVMASGLGKTLTVAFYLKHWFAALKGRVIFVLDQGDPLFQAHREFDRVLTESGITFGFWTGQSKTDNAEYCDVLFTTFQTMRGHKERFGQNAFDLMVVDEAHHGQATTYRGIIEYFKAQRIGLTATPDREDGRDIRELFGDPVYELSLTRALAERKLAQVEYRVMHDNLSIQRLREFVKRIVGGDRTVTRRQLDDTIFLDERFEAIAAKVREVQGGTKKTIFFCRSLEHLAEVQRFFPEVKPYHSKVGKAERQEIYGAFRNGELREISVIDMFNESMDVPSAELLVFWRATDSKRIWLQQLGRGLRGVEKTVIVLDFVGNCDRILAVKELGIEITMHGAGKPDDLATIRINAGFSIAFTEELIEVVKILERLETEFYPALAEASAAAQRLGIRNQKGYQSRYKEDPKLPSNPMPWYRNEWVSWGSFLGTGREIRTKGKRFLTLAEASAAAQKLGIKDSVEYRIRYKEDPGLSSTPCLVYASEWTTWSAFLGTGSYLTLAEASAAAQKLGIKDFKEYRERYKEDPKLSSTPASNYKDVWQGWGEFLGSGKKKKGYRKKAQVYPTLAEASAAAQKLGIKSQREYMKRYKEDSRLPSTPSWHAYPTEWTSWEHFLGITRFYPNLAEASAAAQKLGIKSQREYRERCKEDPKLPSNPWVVYSTEWTDLESFLGTLSFYTTLADTSVAAKRLGDLKSRDEYQQQRKQDPRLPCNPAAMFPREWQGWAHFLGKQKGQK